MRLLLIVLFGLNVSGWHLIAAEAGDENTRAAVTEARKLVSEYEMAEKARAAVELMNASALVHDHDSGKKKATDEELASARELIRKNEERSAEEIERQIADTPLLVVVRRDTRFDIGRLLDAANREFVRRRIATIKTYIKGDEEGTNARIRQELRAWEKGFSEMKPTGKVLPGCQYVTIFEEPDCFVVAYFDNSTTDHFVCSLSKNDYSPLPKSDPTSRKAMNLTQKTVTSY